MEQKVNSLEDYMMVTIRSLELYDQSVCVTWLILNLQAGCWPAIFSPLWTMLIFCVVDVFLINYIYNTSFYIALLFNSLNVF